MASDQRARSTQLVPDPFGGEPPSLRRRMFGKREESRAARRVAWLGGVVVLVAGLHGFLGAGAFALLAGALPWAIERRARAIRRRESETLVLRR